MLSNSPALLTTDPRTWLVAVMNDSTIDMRVRVDVAKTLLRVTMVRNMKQAKDTAAKMRGPGGSHHRCRR